MTEKTDTEQLDWTDISLLVVGAVLILSAIVAFAIFGYAHTLDQAANLANWVVGEENKPAVF
jgi:uncharacterized membrane-anchored protein